MLDKLTKYLPYIAIAVVVYILWSMSRVQNAHTALLIQMAGKLGILPNDQSVGIPPEAIKSFHVTTPQKQAPETPAETESEDERIVRIAEKIYSGKNVGKADQSFYAQFSKDIEEEVQFFLEDDLRTISEKITNGQEISEEQVDLYQKHYTDLSGKLSLKELTIADVTIIPTVKKEIIEPQTKEERKHIVMTFFEDGMPKIIGTIAKLYADKTGLAVSTGNTAKLLDSLLEEKKLMNQKILHNKRNKVFYGRPEWFDGKKFQKEYFKKIV